MIGVTEPPFVCNRCGFIGETLTAISLHENTSHQVQKQKAAHFFPATKWREGIGLVPAPHNTPDYRPKPKPKPKPVPALGRPTAPRIGPLQAGQIVTGTISAALITAGPAFPPDQPVTLVPEAPAEPDPTVTVRWSWFEFRVRIFMMLFAFQHRLLSRHNRKSKRRERKPHAHPGRTASFSPAEGAQGGDGSTGGRVLLSGPVLRVLSARSPGDLKAGDLDHIRVVKDRKAS